MKIVFTILLLSCTLVACQENEKIASLSALVEDSPSIDGKVEYLDSPYVTAGNRVYMVGHQNGSFPDLGWHIKGEMGGIWNHPIKLMDGFDILLTEGSDSLELNQAVAFTNYPMANQHEFVWADKDITIERWQYVPDNLQGVVIQLVIKNQGTEKEIDLSFTGRADLRPTWLGERTDMIDSKDVAHFDAENGVWKVKDSENPWHVVFGSENNTSNEISSREIPSEDYTSLNQIQQIISLAAGQTYVVNYIIAGSYQSEKEALDSFQQIKQNIDTNFSKKKIRYQKLAEQSKLTIPDKEMEQAFEWLKYNSDWLVRTVPEIGTGIGAGIPDYPWWFGVDSEYALKGYMAVGQTETVYNTIELLDSLSNITNGNGRIIHEVSTNGAVFNPGNINETPQFASLIWEVYKWNGDREFLEKYFPTIKKGLDWLMTENDANHNLFPDGYGMMEIHGLDSEMIDVASYTQRAYSDAAQMALVLNEEKLAQQYQETANQLKNKINQEFWSEEFQSYADFIGTDQQALHLIDDAIKRAESLDKPWAVEELKTTRAAILANPSNVPRPYVLHHNWVVNTPMEMNIADQEKAIKALKTAEKFVNPFGVFVTGIDRDESAGSDDGSFKGTKIFSYTGAVMTLPTSVQVVAENNYGNPNQALNYIKRMTRTFSYALPGSMYEVSPDYGMMTQAWNIYGFAVPIVQQFFGIQPDAAHKRVVIQPQMPDAWDTASLENVIVADNSISVFYGKENDQLKLIVEQEKPDWEIEIILPQTIDGKTYMVKRGELTKKRGDFISKSNTKRLEVILEAK